ncbi:CPBP family intramembrane glutamic endopeptidase [Halalkalibaculum sp. DA3122]|uniref:CPBP family intramembrane glutamic endopeptidase n=1 Tax=Halalkalibaculum sp. DA3122 TaxID=3373607 RepID=UPI003754D9D9
MILVHGTVLLVGLSLTQNKFSPEQLFIERLYPIFLAVILLFWTKKTRHGIYKRITEAIKLNKQNLKSFIKYILISFFILYSIFYLSILFGYANFISYGFYNFEIYNIAKIYILVGLLGNLFVAIGEEIVFRGFLFNYIKGISRSEYFSLLFTSLVFSFHIYPDFLNNIIVFLGGLAMGYSYIKFKNLYIAIGIHFAYGFFNLSIASEFSGGQEFPYLMKFDYPMIADGVGAWVDLFIIVGMLAILVFLFFHNVPTKEKTQKLSDLKMEAMES